MEQLVSTIVIVQSQGKFLLVRRSEDDDIFPGKWQNAGGKVEAGETLEEAARREILEETGIQIGSDLQFVMSYSWQKDPKAPWRLGIIMLTTLPSQDVQITLEDELVEYGWFTLEEAAVLDTIGPESPTGTLGQLKKAATQ